MIYNNSLPFYFIPKLISAQEKPWGGLAKEYADQKEGMFMFLFKCIKAIFFSPIEEMIADFEALRRSNLWDSRLDEFCDRYLIVRKNILAN